MEKVPVQSKGIDWVAYDEDAQTLDVHFGSSGTYRYFDVRRRFTTGCCARRPRASSSIGW